MAKIDFVVTKMINSLQLFLEADKEKNFDIMIQRQIKNYKSNNLFVLVSCTKV